MTSLAFHGIQLLGLFAILFFTGCGPSGPQTYKIPGRLVYDDNSPVPGASVVMQTKVGEQIVAARGMVSPEGKFDLTTFLDGDGVVAGEHQVSITPLPIPDGQKPAQPPVAAKYADFTTSGLTTTVTPETKEIVLTINRAGK